MTHLEIIEDFFAYISDSPEFPLSTERFWEKDLLDDKNYIIPYEDVRSYIRRILDIPYGDFLSYNQQHPQSGKIDSKHITQCGSFSSCERDICSVLLKEDNPGLSYEAIGKLLKVNEGSESISAYKKYGENQIKTAKQLGLAFEFYDDWYLSIIGYVYPSLSTGEQRSLLARTLLRDKLYSKIMSDILTSDVELLSYMDCLPSESTKERRIGCVATLVNICLEECQRENVEVHQVKLKGRSSISPTKSNAPRKWRKRNLEGLEIAYKQGKTLAQIITQFDCTEEGAIYQLKTYCNIEHPFEDVTQQSNETILGIEKSSLTPEQVEVGERLQKFLDSLEQWPKSKLRRLKELYQAGRSPQDMISEFGCTREELTTQLTMHIGVKHPFYELDKKPWTDDLDQQLLRLYAICNNDIQNIADALRCSTLKIKKRLYDLTGRSYEGMPQETKKQRIVSETRRNRWKSQRGMILSQIAEEKKRKKEERRRKKEEAQLKVNGFYIQGAHINHPQWGNITVLKDNEKVLKFIDEKGTTKSVKK